MRILAPAKVNLFLEVGRKKNKYHPIISLMDIVSLCDIIEIEKTNDRSISFKSNWTIPQNNTVKKTIELLEKIYNRRFNVRITVKKEIPPAAGLGGGSSDAAAVLILINSMYKLNMTEEEMLKIAAQIGSDVPFFLYKRTSIVGGYGEIVQPLAEPIFLYYLLLIPDKEILTEKVYDRLDITGTYGDLTKGKEQIKILIKCLKNGDLNQAEKIMFNRLENACFEIWPEGKEVMKEAEKQSGRKFFLSGSGGTMYSVFNKKESIKKIDMSFLPEGWKFLIVKSFSSI